MNLKFILIMITIVTMINIKATACHLPPTTIATYRDMQCLVNKAMLFDASASNSDNCPLKTGWKQPYWVWDFAYNGSFQPTLATSVGTVTHTFTQPGIYAVAVRYYDHANLGGNIVEMTVEVVDLQRCYYLTDHLGSIKMTVSEGPSTAGLVGYWSFEEGGQDLSESNIAANISNTNMLTAGKYGQGVTLTDDITKYIDLGLSETLRPGRISITAWIKPTGFVPVKENDIVVEEGYGYRIFYLSNGSLWFVIHDQTADLHDGNGELVYYVNNCINNDGNWHHIAATYGNDRRMRIYVDGELKGTSQVYTGGNGDIKYVNPQHVTVGHNGGWRAGMMGAIDEVKIYNRGLSQSEINRDYIHDVQILGYDDYDPWGKQLEGRCMNAENPQDKYKFTGKERDVETGYDYVTHRYYDPDVARWLQGDPLADKYPGWSPYNYCLNNPMRFVDMHGDSVAVNDDAGWLEKAARWVFGMSSRADQTISSTNASLSGIQLQRSLNGVLSFTGTPVTSQEIALAAAINSNNIMVNLLVTSSNSFNSNDGDKDINFIVGAFDGGIKRSDGVISTNQIFNLSHAEVWSQAGGSSVGVSATHEIVESFLGAQQNKATLTSGGSYGYSEFGAAHAATLHVVPNGFSPVPYYPKSGVGTYGVIDINGVFHPMYSRP